MIRRLLCRFWGHQLCVFVPARRPFWSCRCGSRTEDAAERIFLPGPWGKL